MSNKNKTSTRQLHHKNECVHKGKKTQSKQRLRIFCTKTRMLLFSHFLTRLLVRGGPVSSSAPRPRNFLASGREESSGGGGRFRRFCDGKDCLEVGDADSAVVGFKATAGLLLFCRLETRLSLKSFEIM